MVRRYLSLASDNCAIILIAEVAAPDVVSTYELLRTWSSLSKE
jgi:hypothetical protein